MNLKKLWHVRTDKLALQRMRGAEKQIELSSSAQTELISVYYCRPQVRSLKQALTRSQLENLVMLIKKYKSVRKLKMQV